MSTRIMGLCWPLQMRPPAKAVLMSLADMANDEGFCWPSLERICERTCFGRTAVIDAISSLEVSGVVRADRTNGRKTTYWVEPAKFTANAVDNSPDPSATRTGTPDGPVRHADSTGTPRGLNRSATRTLTVKNRQETKTPQPPADAGGERDAMQLPAKPDAGANADGGFDAAYRRYPKKKAEPRARRAWNKLAPNPALQLRIIAAIEAQARTEDWQREGGRYVPMFSSWLHGERWRDVVDSVPPNWWHSSEGIQAMGASLGMPFSLAALGNAFTDDQRQAHWRAYRVSVLLAAGDGPWSEGVIGNTAPKRQGGSR
ncbi:helix-turn-helix domain-containing protein [Variovorax paradoxus]|uniref:helix-turn-helix domain-containing protein n=1 Tax=Variovorax paradoxus TaxID=34073 RepID=UPI003AACCA02